MSDSKARDYQIKKYTNKVQEMLLSKNKAYGNSALEPLNIFNKGRRFRFYLCKDRRQVSKDKERGYIRIRQKILCLTYVGYLILLMISMEDNETRDI